MTSGDVPLFKVDTTRQNSQSELVPGKQVDLNSSGRVTLASQRDSEIIAVPATALR
jgi:hypothetical protein